MTIESILAQYEQETYSGSIVPLYLEPTMGSGERITFAVAANTEKDEYMIHRLLHLNVLRCMYGEENARILESIIELSLQSLGVFFADNKCISGWEPATSGIILGSVIDDSCGYSLEDFINQGVLMYGSLGDTFSVIEAPQSNQQRWVSKVRDEFVKRKSPLASCFNKKLPLEGYQKPVPCDFYHQNLIADFISINPGNFSSSNDKILYLDDIAKNNLFGIQLRIIFTIEAEAQILIDQFSLRKRESFNKQVYDLQQRCTDRKIKPVKKENTSEIFHYIVEQVA